MINNKHINSIIIGAGISGISLAKKLSGASIDNYIFESNKIGGCIDSISYDHFWFEMGAHTLYNSYIETIKYLGINYLNQNIQIRKKLPFLFIKSNNEMQSIFRNINFLIATIKFIKNRKILKDDKTVRQYATALFGESNYINTLKYCFDAVLSQNSENFPMKYLFNKYIRNKTLPRSFTLNKGLSHLFHEHKQNIISNEVINVSKQDNKWIIKTNDLKFSCDNLCFATPWNITKSLLKKILPSIVTHKFRPTMSNITSIGIVINKDKLKHIKNLSGLIGKKLFFYSAVSRDVIDNKNYRAIVFHCHNYYSKENLLSKIIDLLKINLKDIITIKIKNNTLPCYDNNHSIFISDFEKELQKQKTLFITGNFFKGISIENCIQRSNEQANKIIENKSINDLIISHENCIV